jgi:hypothetical protein
MTDDLETRVAERLRTAILPVAPASLRSSIRELAQAKPGRSMAMGRRLALASPALVVVLIAIAAGLALPGSPPGTTPSPSTSATWAATRSPGRFEAPGIQFSHPTSWVSLELPADWVNTWSRRYVGYLTDASAPCWHGETPTAFPTTGPCAGDVDGLPSGSLNLYIWEDLHPPPGQTLYGRPTIYEPETVWHVGDGGLWWATDPGGGMYELVFDVRNSDLDARKPEMQALIDSLQLTDWARPEPSATDGWVDIQFRDLIMGYPAGWAAYAIQNEVVWGGGPSPFMLLASKPLEPCTDYLDCHMRNPPDDAILIEAYAGGGWLRNTDWSTTANTQVDGHPAQWHDRGIFDGVERQSWHIQLYETGSPELDLEVASTRHDDAAIGVALDAVLEHIDLPDTTAPMR